ncbi:MAG: hypothetical protein Fur0037_01430 [Planctomycetota bacterium]
MSRKFDFRVGDRQAHVQVEHRGGDRYRVTVDGRPLDAIACAGPDGGVRIAFGDGPARRAFLAPCGQGLQVRLDGRTLSIEPPTRAGRAAHGSDGIVRAPMTGTVLKVACRAGDRVAADQTLVVLTAMKMEHKLSAGVAGVVERVAAAEGDTVDQGVELVVVSPEGADEEGT